MHWTLSLIDDLSIQDKMDLLREEIKQALKLKNYETR